MRKRSEIFGVSSEEQFQDIYHLIEQARYTEAFELLETMEDPRAKEWLAKLEDASPGVLNSVRVLRAAGQYETLDLAIPTGQRWLDSLKETRSEMQKDNSADSTDSLIEAQPSSPKQQQESPAVLLDPMTVKPTNAQLQKLKTELAEVKTTIYLAEIDLRYAEGEIADIHANFGTVDAIFIAIALFAFELQSAIPFVLALFAFGSIYRAYKRNRLKSEWRSTVNTLLSLRKKHGSLTKQIIELEASL